MSLPVSPNGEIGRHGIFKICCLACRFESYLGHLGEIDPSGLREALLKSVGRNSLTGSSPVLSAL